MLNAVPTIDYRLVTQFHQDGYLPPRPVWSPGQMQDIWTELDQTVLAQEAKNGQNRMANRHMDSQLICRMACNTELIAPLIHILGPDLLMWASYFWIKEPGGLEIPWHQDFAYWPLEPKLTITAWIALADIDVAHGCIQLIPGSHRSCLPHVDSQGTRFAQAADPTGYDANDAVTFPMRAGEVIYFNERLLHHSEANRHQTPRLAMSMRFTIPQVHVFTNEGPLSGTKGHRCLLVSGEDRYGFNAVMELP